MNKPIRTLIQHTIQASILAFLFWLGIRLMDWPWLIFLVIATLLYALVCFGYALVLWCNR